MSALAQIDEKIREIDARIAALQAQVDRIRSGERTKVIEDICAKIGEYGITAAELHLEARRGLRAMAHNSGIATARRQRVVKYRSPVGETWSGGPGRKPKWVAEVLAQGKSIEEFAV